MASGCCCRAPVVGGAQRAPAEIAALTEPMAVGLARRQQKGNLEKGQGALVLGCGPVGLAVIAALKIKGAGPIIAADFSPARRRLAVTMGAHTRPIRPSRGDGRGPPGPEPGTGGAVAVFEAIGVPGILNDILRSTPAGARVVVVGVCMQDDIVNPFFGISKELNIQFALAYDPMEFGACLRLAGRGRDRRGGDDHQRRSGSTGCRGRSIALGNPDDEHCKIMVTPGA